MITLHSSRLTLLSEEFEKAYFQSIKHHLHHEIAQGKTIYPPWPLIFNAFDSCPVDDVKIVILGQDPYHGPGQAMGLSFSVPEGIAKPPSLVNIYKELAEEYPWYDTAQSWDLTRWSKQGVLLLNAILTVRAHEAASHSTIGRQTFTDRVIQKLSEQTSWLVFLLRGNFAISKKSLIDSHKHCILTAAHPSPLSAHRGWFGCRCFRKCNEYLQQQWKEGIIW
jgi:uracil-DNA glycosylase